MPKQGTRAEVNTFVKGLVTEASPLNFPANASLDEVNFELLRDGTRKRRLGMTDMPQTAHGTNLDLTFPTSGFSQFIWKAAGGNTAKDFLVIQMGKTIEFHEIGTNRLPSLQTYTTTFDQTISVCFTSVNGRLVIAAGSQLVLVCSYLGTTFNFAYQSILVRDVWGVEDADSPGSDDVHSGTISPAGVYNLQNQSWGIPRRTTEGTLVNPAAIYKQFLNQYPSNREVVWSGLAYVPQTGSNNPFEALYLNLYAERYGAGTGASKGYFIIDLLNRGVSRTQQLEANYVKFSPNLTRIVPDSTIPAINPDVTAGGATVVTTFAGRVFYAGFSGNYSGGDKRSPTLNNYICFSQLVKNDADLTKCYQVGDPTSRDDSDVVDTDGGFVRVSGARNIVAMDTLGSTLIIFADNGVWSLTGGDNYGFSATNYKVDKLSDFGCIAPNSVVTDNNNLLFWGSDAIYAISPNNVGNYLVDDITRETIQTKYNAISLDSKRNCQGVYDLYTKKLRWIYSTGTRFTAGSSTSELVFDISLKCFYINTIGSVSDNTRTIAAPIFYPYANVPLAYIYLSFGVHLGLVTYGLASYLDTTFRDWKEYDGVGIDAKAYLLTGAMLAGDSAVNKQTPYIITHLRKTEKAADVNGVLLTPSSCLLRTQWDWANSINSKKFGSTQEVYRDRHPILPDADGTYDSGFDVVSSKSKLRGIGKALSLYFETSPDKDCQLLGWSLTINGNALA